MPPPASASTASVSPPCPRALSTPAARRPTAISPRRPADWHAPCLPPLYRPQPSSKPPGAACRSRRKALHPKQPLP